MVVIDDEARLITAMRQAKEEGTGLDVDVVEAMRALLGELISPFHLHSDAAGDMLSPRCSEPADLMSISTDA